MIMEWNNHDEGSKGDVQITHDVGAIYFNHEGQHLCRALKDEEPDDQWGEAPQDSGAATAKAPRQ